MNDPYNALKEALHRTQDLSAAASVLEWDQETYMPPGAAEARAHQIATLRRLAHEHFTDDAVGTMLDALGSDASDLDPDSVEAALVRVTKRDYDRATKLPADLVAELAMTVSRAKQAWKKAREDDAYPTFAPHLAHVIDLCIQKAEAWGYDDRIYDALLDEYEPGMRTATVERVFTDLRQELVPIVHAIAQDEPPDDAFLHRAFDPQKQWDFGLDVIRAFGYDFDRGRQDRSAHPFTTSFSITDVRITTRVDEHFLPMGLFGTLHEAGHALYEQGIDPAMERTPLADGTSLAMHESQSRLWENLVGRSRPFWHRYFPELKATFPQALDGVDVDAFYRAINKVAPSFIRVEADEVTYNLHIMLRFELENAMVEQRVSVDELPDLWNSMMEEYLGIVPENDAQGVLQDIHWSLGAIGYFPTYALGTLMSAQLFDQARADVTGLDELIAGGQFHALLSWLRLHIHRHGRARSAEEILRDTTGQGLTADHWLAYVRRKYGALYPTLE